MSNPITIKATRGVWLPPHNNLSDVSHYLEQGKTDLALSLLSIVGPASWETFSDYIRVGDAEVTFTLLPRDEQAALAVMQLRAKLDKLREAYAEAQREILAQISKYEALTNEVTA